jgi:outer membrane protein TolC
MLVCASGCALTEHPWWGHVLLPEQQTISVRDPARLPAMPMPTLPAPRTVSNPDPKRGEWQLSLNEAIQIALVNARVVRVLTGIAAASSGRTIYDAAITNTSIDQQQARFDPVVDHTSRWSHTETPDGTFDPFNPSLVRILGSRADAYRADSRLSQTNVLGGQWALNWVENPVGIARDITTFPAALNPVNRNFLEMSYTQPFLQGGGFVVNTAPIVLARIDTERSFFQYKDSVQELVRGVIEAYWNLVQARTDVWARQIQLDTAEEAFKRDQARLNAGFADARNVAQSRVTYQQFRANLIASRATVLAREGAMRNLLGLPPEDERQIVPISAPASERFRPDWDEIVRLAEQRRPDIVELKLILEADQIRLVQSENLALPRLDVVSAYRWNGLSGEKANGDRISSNVGQFTDWSVGVNFSVPLGLRSGRAQVRQQALLIARDRANLEQGLHATVHSLAITVRELDSAFEQYLVYKEVRQAALQNLRVQIAQYQQRGEIYLNVLQALNDWGNAVLFEAQSLISYNIALATLEQQTGTILETHGLVFHEERFQAAGPLGVCGHERDYPSALPATARPTRYPPTDEPGENAFDLKKPDLRGTGPKDTLPPPRRLPDKLPDLPS